MGDSRGQRHNVDEAARTADAAIAPLAVPAQQAA
jgi:hypothetical protein